MYSHYLEVRGVKCHEGMWGFPIVNIKVIKIMFNRAYRMSHSQPEKAIQIYKELLEKLSQLLPKEQDSYYFAKINLELAKTFATQQDKESAHKHAAISQKMLEKEYG